MSQAKSEAEDLAEKATRASRAKDEFLATMSHEIRTPLNGIIGMTSLLLETELNPEQQEFFDTIRFSSETLLTLINDILDFAKIESEKLDLEMITFNCETVIDEAISLVRPKAEGKEIEFIINYPPNLPRFIDGDMTRIRQILLNLVNNAVKFTEKGEIVVSVREIKTIDDRVLLKFTVSDTGIGIPEEKINCLFRSFSQVDSSTTRKYGGTGLGLAISKRLVELMGGLIWVDSRNGKGSQFHFTIQTRYSENQATDQLDALKTILKGKKILVVDDNVTNLKIFKAQLQNWEMHPVTVEMPQQAMSVIESSGPFDILILDMQMPDLTGIDLAKKVRELYNSRELPIVIVSSVNKPEELKQYEQIINDYLTKPVKQTYMIKTLAHWLEIKTPDSAYLREREQRPADPQLNENFAAEHPARILIAEDNLINQKIAAKILEKMGYNVQVALNGLEAMKQLEVHEFDLIFMDVNMPEMDGLEATAKIIGKNGNYRPLMIAMTANAMSGDRERFIAAGMDDYISKPVKISDIQALLAKYFKRQS